MGAGLDWRSAFTSSLSLPLCLHLSPLSAPLSLSLSLTLSLSLLPPLGSTISVEFKASLEGHVGLPEWLSLFQPRLSSPAYLYGTPPVGLGGVVEIGRAHV